MARNYNTENGVNRAAGWLFKDSQPGWALYGLLDPLAGIGNAFYNLLGSNSDNTMAAASGLFNEYFGISGQQREFEQQEYLQDKMNQWNTPEAVLERFRQAGINPNLAASAVLGNPAESAQAPSVPSNAGSMPAGVQGISSAVGAVNQSLNNAAQRRDINASAELKHEQAVSESQLRDANKAVLEANRISLLEKAGVDYWTAMTLTKRYNYIDDETLANLANIAANTKLLRQQRKNLKSQRDNIIAEYDLILAKTEAEHAAADEATKNAALAKVRADRERVLKQLDESDLTWLENYGVRRGDPLYNVVMSLLDDPDETKFQKVLDGLMKVEYSQNYGRFAAEVDTAYNKVRAEAKAKAEVDADYAQYYAIIENNQEIVKKLLDVYYDLKITSDPLSWITEILKRTNAVGTFQFTPRVTDPQKPEEGDPNK